MLINEINDFEVRWFFSSETILTKIRNKEENVKSDKPRNIT